MKVDLKQRYRLLWPRSLIREIVVANVLSALLPPGYRVLIVGLGAGLADEVEGWHRGLEDAFDLVVARVEDRGPRPLAFIDVTGVHSDEEMVKTVDEGRGLCIGVWKLWKAEKYGVLDRTWFCHVTASRVALRWLPAPKAQGRRVSLVKGEKPYICIPARDWLDTRAFIRWLLEVSRVG